MRTGGGAVGYVDGATAGADGRFADGWTRTKDLGVVDAEGEIHLVGRANELVFLRGGRLSPDAIEEMLARRVPGSVEFAVAGVPVPDDFDAIAVFVSRAGTADVERARDVLLGLRGPFRPKLVLVVDEIPRGPLGKPLRRELVDGLRVGG